ncbi:MAG: acyl-CoA dehydrogenase family protein [Haloarculaceae archaeon]
MDFEPSSEVRQIQRMVDDFIDQEIAPLEEEYDHFLGEDREMGIMEGTGADYRMSEEYLDLWQEIREKSAEAGIWTMHMPEPVGGGGVDVLPFVQVIEHIEHRNPDGFHQLVWDTGTVTEMMLPAYDDDYQRETYFEPMMSGEKLSAFALTEPGHGSDATHMETTAEKEGDEWVIDGQKAFISKGAASDFLMVHARTAGDPGDVKGITSFLVDSDNPGVSVDKVQRPLGGQPGRQAILSFDACRVPEENVLGEVGEGFAQLIGWIGAGRLTIPASAVGKAEWMLEQSVEYAKQRETFGSKIGDYQGVQFQLADLAADIEQTRWTTRHAAWKVDQGERAVKEQSIAKMRGGQLWNDAADVAVQVHGGAGFMRSLPFAEEYREARAARIYEGTDEIQKRTIARELF